MNPQRFLSHVALMLGLVAGAGAATTENLAAWSVMGADKAALSAADALVLPAGAQLYRTIPPTTVTLRLESQPVFGQTATDLAVLELGDVAVAFLRERNMGKLVLVLGNNPAFPLPCEIALDASGRSADRLQLTVSREGATVAVTAQGRIWQFPAGYSAGPQDVVISAGTGGWPIQDLALVVVATPDSAPGATKGIEANPARGQADQVRQRIEGELTAGESSDTNMREGDARAGLPATVQPETPASTRPTLELFTPPSVRPGRAAAVRAMVIQSRQK